MRSRTKRSRSTDPLVDQRIYVCGGTLASKGPFLEAFIRIAATIKSHTSGGSTQASAGFSLAGLAAADLLLHYRRCLQARRPPLPPSARCQRLRLWARLSACSPAMPAPFAPVAADDKCPPTAFAQIVLGHRVQLRGSAAARHICERAHLGRRCHGPLARAVLRCLAAVAMKPRALYPGFQTPAS